MRGGGEPLPGTTTAQLDRGELRRRRREIADQLEGAGFSRAALAEVPRWLDPRVQARIRRLGPELRALGPLFCRFGRYLSTRLDQLSGADCLDLASLPDRGEPLPEAEFQRRLHAELGGGRLARLARLDAVPVESLVLSQTHRGWLSDGRIVSVKLARTELLASLDLATLPHLAGYLSSLGWPLTTARRVVADFEDFVRRRLDLSREAEALGRLASLTGEAGVRAPRVVEALSTPSVLTLELPPGAPVSTAGGEAALESTGAARVLTDVWMRLVFDGLRIPEELSRAEVWRAPGGVLELTGGLFQTVPTHDAAALWRYLLAAARDDPDGVFEALQELVESGEAARPQALRHQLGHVVPRRDGRFGEAPPGFPELLLSHWQQVERHGLVPNASLQAFYRGLVALRELTGPELSRGVLRESLQVEQISRGGERLRKAFDPSRLAQGAEGAVRILAELPRTLERLGRSLDGRSAAPPATEAASPDRSVGWTALAAAVLAATALVWFERLPDLLGRWTEPLQALAVALLGAGLLRWVWRD